MADLTARKAMEEILGAALKAGASDLHLVTGVPPVMRVSGEIVLLQGDKLDGNDTRKLIFSLMTPGQIEKFVSELQASFSFELEGLGRFRTAVYYHKGAVEASFRLVPYEVKTLEELGLPEVVADLTRRPNGLILVTGPTSSGKTTTFNSMIDLINRERRLKIITVEDPIEFVHTHKKSIVIQQEVYSDTPSFQSALVHILRQNPDVIGVGEMRDLDTISTAITAAETGHLVIATIHTNDACQTIDRIIDVFPPHQQTQIRVQLANSLQGVISQMLLPKIGGGRVLACEILIAVNAVRRIIREGNTSQLYTFLQTGRQHQMQTMDDSLKELYQQGKITYATAVMKARDPKEFQKK